MADGIKILCVDDEKLVLRSLVRFFMDDGYELFTALSGEEGLQILEDEPGIQIIISDYRMPGMSGVEFLKMVCARRPETVRLVLSGFADTATIVDSINDGHIYKFIPKPWEEDKLRNTVRAAIEKYFKSKESSEIVKKLEEVKEKILLFNAIMESLPFGLLAVDSYGRVAFCNQQGKELLGAAGSKKSTDLAARDLLPAAGLDLIKKISATGQRQAGSFTIGGKELCLHGSLLTKDDAPGTILIIEPPQ